MQINPAKMAGKFAYADSAGRGPLLMDSRCSQKPGQAAGGHGRAGGAVESVNRSKMRWGPEKAASKLPGDH